MGKKQQRRYDELYKKWSSNPSSISENESKEMDKLSILFGRMIEGKKIRNGMIRLGGIKGLLQ